MTIKEAHETIEWLKTSVLVKAEGLTIEAAAEVYDDMNETTEYTEALKVLSNEKNAFLAKFI